MICLTSLLFDFLVCTRASSMVEPTLFGILVPDAEMEVGGCTGSSTHACAWEETQGRKKADLCLQTVPGLFLSSL